jgi:hypothetical protein
VEYIYYETKRGRCRYRAERKICPICNTEALMLSHVTHCSRQCAARARVGPANPMWKGDEVKWGAARSRAHARFPDLLPCQDCGRTDDVHRHHIDGNTRNNEASNIAFLCPTCHGRHHRKPRRACKICGAACRRATNVYCSRTCQGKAQTSANLTRTHCNAGHVLTARESGERACLECGRQRGRRYRQRQSEAAARAA